MRSLGVTLLTLLLVLCFLQTRSLRLLGTLKQNAAGQKEQTILKAIPDVGTLGRRELLALGGGLVAAAGMNNRPAGAWCGDPYPAWAYTLNFNDGVIPYQGSQLYIRVVGDEYYEKRVKRKPLIVLPGGPGLSHDYLETLEAVSQTQRRVVLFDPLGTGQSGPRPPAAASAGSPRSLLDQLNRVISELGLKEYHLFAHGYSSVVALEKLKQLSTQEDNPGKPKGKQTVLSVTFESPFAKGEDLIEAADALEAKGYPWKTSPNIQSKILGGNPDLKKTPVCMEDSYKTSDAEAYGPEIRALKGWNCASYVDYVKCPMIVTYGRRDLISETSVTEFKDTFTAPAKPGNEVYLSVYENSGHLAHIDEKETYIQMVQNFLDKVDKDQEDMAKKKKQI
uniref:AB hydrolase-1 domain-containing protein n=1 Tax=Heterosigma akashiwo TaxID=2829 RepID=A0A7S3XPS5_HETAK